MLTRTLFAAAALAMAGCATQDQFATLRTDFLQDRQGNVIGERETLRNLRTGEVIERTEIFILLLDSQGGLLGYEQRLKNGSIVRDSEGRPIGARFVDLRSRGTNPNSPGLLILY
jgi:hypothetical protein